MNKRTDNKKDYVTALESQETLARSIGLKRLYLKREDLHPYGSHKGRSIPFMIDFYANQGVKRFAISSSGNAALSACMYIAKLDDHSMTLEVFVGNNANKNKVSKLKSFEGQNIKVLIKERPLQSLLLAEQDGATSLRQSTNDVALEGYETLAKEIVDQLQDVGAKEGSVFIGTSSGTTAQAMAKYFLSKKLKIQVHIVQTSSCHPIVDAFGITDIPDERSIADAIVDQTAHRKDALVQLINDTGGKGWVVTNEEIEIAKKVVKDNSGLDLSSNGVLGIAAAMQATYTGHDLGSAVVCIVGGE